MARNIFIAFLSLEAVSLVIAANIWPEKQMLFLFGACVVAVSVPLIVAATKQPKRVALTIKFRGR